MHELSIDEVTEATSFIRVDPIAVAAHEDNTLVVRREGKDETGRRVTIDGPSVLVMTGDLAPMAGARVVLVTDSPVSVA